ncbi:MAG: transcription-repair coupling factor [Bacilli bacterium]|jgi:transcription-repair coupling factor (superfamily II helicase)|nr:transcription-repair coupling factor [Bacilli bacterium]
MDFLSSYFKYENNITIMGLTKELAYLYVDQIYREQQKDIIVLTSTLYEANNFFAGLKTFNDNVYLFPMDDFLTSQALAISPELKTTRIETLEHITNSPNIIVTNLMGYLKYLTSSKVKNKLNIKLKVGEEINREKLIRILEELDYKRESIVTSTGEYAIRGFVIDIFITLNEHPIRIEFFGNSIDSIRYFDENTQKSIENITEINLISNGEIKTEEKSSLYDYTKEAIVIIIDENRIKASYQKLEEEMFEFRVANNLDSNTKFMFSMDEINPKENIYINFLDNKITNSNYLNFSSQELTNFNSNLERLKDQTVIWHKKGYNIIFYLSKENQRRIIKENITVPHKVIPKFFPKGFIFEKYVIITENDIENVTKQEIKYKNSYKIGRKIKDLNALNLGDYVVHMAHGIGIYNGIKTLTTNGLKKDYLEILYDGNDKVYIPVEKINTILKYANKDGLKPKINKLSSTSWAKTKRSVEKRIKDISEELLKLYAERKALKGDVYETYELEKEFASSFQYSPTRDQEKAINEIDKDLQDKVPMDRLLCGDVGFGKTEVAFRAMFKAIVNNKQVFYLCPTTILSKQQYNAALNRFKDYPVNIALLNRFTSAKETKRIITELENGKIDIVFGTHRLLSDDVKFQKLGLLIVDEEQRFGVTHKEKIKKYKTDVNVLTLSATPIPRTLKMAMSGLRDLSVIDTAPVNRYPIQTYVLEEQDLIVKDAIYKELSRQGQVFILYNNIEHLESIKRKISELVPEARIVSAHGRMTKQELEDIMESFIEYKYDILVCTTIIETGIDIPNANTLIIYNADHFGLSQLYQIRGRVGRSNKIAYAYLLYDKSKILNEIAIKRLEAIKEFTELGSGYRIAMRDLSIRGAGDILGSEQAGFVDSVGINLYMQMIEEEMKRLKGEEIIPEDDSAPALVNVSTHISDEYIADDEIKIEIHSKINEIDSKEKLGQIKEELEDRFGKVSEEIIIYMYEEWFEKLAKSLNIKRVIQNRNLIELELPEDISNKIKADKLFLESYTINPNLKYKYQNKRIKISLILKKDDKHFLYTFVPLLELIKSYI